MGSWSYGYVWSDLEMWHEFKDGSGRRRSTKLDFSDFETVRSLTISKQPVPGYGRLTPCIAGGESRHEGTSTPPHGTVLTPSYPGTAASRR